MKQAAVSQPSITQRTYKERFDHTSSKPSDLPRVDKLRDANIEAVVGIIAERAKIYTEVYKATEGEPEAIRRAKAFARTLREMEIDILEDELLVANASAKLKKMQIYPEIWHKSFYQELDEISKRPDSALDISEEDKKVLLEEVYPYWKNKNMTERLNRTMPEKMLSYFWKDSEAEKLDECAVSGTLVDLYCLTNDQTRIDYENLLKSGFNRMKEKAEKEAERFYNDEILGCTDPDNVGSYNYCKSIAIAYEAAEDFVKRYADLARQKAEKEAGKRKDELSKIAEVCDRIAENAPRTFWEALQMVQFIMIINQVESVNNVRNLGRWDQYLYPFYRKDIEEGRITQIEAQELIDCFWIKCANFYQPRPTVGTVMYGGFATWNTIDICGVKPDGTDATNELSWMALQATADTRLYQPDISVLYHHGISDEIMKRACEVSLLGTGHPKFYNHDRLISMTMEEGRGRIPIEEARQVSATGCTEHLVLHKSSYNPTNPHGNLAGCVEFALNNGRGRMIDRQFGPRTGDPRKFKNFEEFRDAFQCQIEHHAKMISAAEAFGNAVRQGILYCPFQCGSRDDLIEKGADFTADIDKLKDEPYGWWLWVVNGFADCVESLNAVDTLVFKKKLITMDEFIDALDNNYEGEHERVLRMIENEMPHYGNDDREADKYAEMVSKIVSGAALKYYKNPSGQSAQPDILSLTINVGMGAMTGALPSGKRAGMPNADASGPVYGFDKEGPTACIRSVAKSCAAVSYETGRPNMNLLNIRFQPELIYTEGGIDNWASLVRLYHETGGMDIQFNVVSSDTLKDAQKRPEKYPDLLVRVAGFSVYFTTLAKAVQDDVISRTEYKSW